MQNYAQKKLRLKDRMQIRIRKAQLKKYPTWSLAVCSVLLLALLLLIQFLSVRDRESRVQSVERGQLQLTFVGSVYPGGDLGILYDKYGTQQLLSSVDDLWANSDHVFADLEGPILTRKLARYTPLDVAENLRNSPSQVRALIDAGVDVFSIANDHTGDYQKRGLTDTVKWLDENEVLFAGYLPYEMATSLEDEANGEESNNFTRVDCGDMKAGFISLTTYYYVEEARYGVLSTARNELLEYVMDAAVQNDLVVVYVHWKDFGSHKITDEQRQLGHDLVNAGANLVIGTGVSTLQPIEQYGRGLICYNIGSFLKAGESTFSRDSVMLQYNIDADGVKSLSLYPVRLQNGIPRLADSGFYNRRILNRLLSELAEDSYSVEQGIATIRLK